jgi:alkylation response protein AidB-like acyl-CoA dehydrogenase
VPAENIIGTENKGFKAMMFNFVNRVELNTEP